MGYVTESYRVAVLAYPPTFDHLPVYLLRISIPIGIYANRLTPANVPLAIAARHSTGGIIDSDRTCTSASKIDLICRVSARESPDAAAR